MGASLSVNLSQKSYDAATRTSVIHVDVTLTSNAGTHNHYTDENRGAIFTIIIDDREYSGVCPFGSSDSGTFTENLFSSDIAVVHSTDSTTSFFVHASLYTGTSAGTVSDSASMSLPPAGGSSGGSGSDSGDDDYEGGGSSGGSSGGGVNRRNAKIIEHCFVNHFQPTVSSYTNSGGCVVGTKQAICHATVFKFRTPKFNGTSISVDVNIVFATNYFSANIHEIVGIAICTSVNSLEPYFTSPASVYDPNMVASGLFQKDSTVCTIPTDQLKSETTYYLVLWDKRGKVASSNDYGAIGYQEYHSINVNYVEGSVYIDSGSGFDSYQVFIDNGTSWDLAIPFNDNGTSWDLCS